jgi:hypothetical protein
MRTAPSRRLLWEQLVDAATSLWAMDWDHSVKIMEYRL